MDAATPPPARYGWLLLVAAAMSVALAATLGLGAWQTERASTVLIDGQAAMWLQRVVELMGPRREFRSRDFLETLLEHQHPNGLRWVALIDGAGSVLASAGEPSVPANLVQPEEAHPVRLGTRIRAASVVRAPPAYPPPAEAPWLPPPGGFDPLWSFPPAPPDRLFALPAQEQGAAPRLVLEFEPQLTDELAQLSRVTLVVGLGTLGVFLALAVVFVRLLAHRDALTERLERERHLSALGEMSAVLAHELRNPIASLKGNAQLLAEGLPPGGREHVKAVRVVGEALRLEQLTSDLLDFVRSGRTSVREVHPATLVHDAARAVGVERLVLDERTAPAKWRLDPDRIQQVLTNLLQNALQASPPDASVDVTIRRTGRTLTIEVRDHGTGLPEGNSERLFDAFFTTRTRGTGLGLAVARRIVAAHGGEIRAGNHDGGGAVFTIELPES